MHRFFSVAAAFLLLAPLWVSPARAQWLATGNPAATSSVSERFGDPASTSLGPSLCTDGDNGLICAWVAPKPGALEVRVNRLAGADGARLWGVPEGVLANTGYVAAGAPQVESDGAGGAWVAWRDDRPGAEGVYVQRYDAAGTAQLAAGGVRAATSSAAAFDVATTASGKLLLAIGYPASSAAPGVYVQRLSMAGGLELTAAGRKMSSDPGSSVLQIFGDGEGGVVTWSSARATLPGSAGESRVVANRFNSFGTALWSAEGAVVQAGDGTSALDHRAAWDGTYLFVTWMDAGGDSTVRAQRLDGSGAAGWGATTSGIAVVQFARTAFMNAAQCVPSAVRPQIAADGFGGCLVVWIDGRDYARAGSGPGVGTHEMDVYAQAISAPGTPRFASAVAVDSARGDARSPHACSDGDHGTYVAFRQTENLTGGGAEDNVRMLRWAYDGAVRWSLRPHLAGAAMDGAQSRIHVAPDGLGGVIAAWQDGRSGGTADDVYATHRTANALLACDPLAPQSPVGGVDGPNDLIAGDWNEDGIADVAAASASSGVKVYLGQGAGGVGNGTFAAPSTIAVATAQAIAAGDLDGDGIDDLVVSHSTSGVYVSLGQGAGGIGNGTFGAVSAPLAMGSGVRGVALADFDEDGILDVVTANLSSDNVSVRLGNGTDGVGNGTFAAAVSYAAGDSPLRVLVDDFDDDGIWDLAVSNSSGTASSVSILRGQGANGAGDGTFAAPTAFACGSTPTSLAAGDFDEDGITDLAAGFLSGVVVLRGLGSGGVGDGTFAAPNSYAVGSGPARALVVGDWNDDGRSDLAVTEPTQDRVHLLTGGGLAADGDGSFRRVLTRPVGDLPNAMIGGDFLEDGVADLVVAGTNSDDLRLLAGGCALTSDASLTLHDPSGGSVGVIGQTLTITWGRGVAVQSVDVEVSRDGANWQTIARQRTGTSFAWTVTPPASGSARVRVRDTNVPGRISTSAPFTISAGPAVSAPLAGGSSLSAAWPSPARGPVSLTLTLAHPGDVRAEVFDARGRHVQTIARETRPAGAHALVWRRAGARSGLYFLRVRWPGGDEVRRVVLVD